MIQKALVWNIRLVRSQHAFNRVQMLNKHHKFFLIALMEPFQHTRHIQKYKRRLGTMFFNYNQNGKICVFVQKNIQVQILSNSEQKITLQITFQASGDSFICTLVYAKCSALERLNLWDDIYSLSHNMRLPWLVGWDFNVILNDEENIGGLPVYPQEYEDFAFCVNSCELFDINFKGSPFIWWNGRADSECIFKRLYRLMINQFFLVILEMQNWSIL